MGKMEIQNRLYKTIKSIIVAIVVLMNHTIFAQNILRGTITDSTSNEALFGATIVIQGTSLGASADIDGKYKITGISSAECNVVVSYVGYIRKIIHVNFSGGERTENVMLVPQITTTNEVVVTAQLQGQMGAINQQKTSSTIVNIVSKDRIEELPDNNAAETIGRLPGISIQRDAGEGTKIIMRGLSPKFNLITIDGQKVPSTDMVDRSVDLSMISSDMLAGIEVSKAITPNMDGDAVGGTVNFTMKKADAGLKLNFKAQGGYNHQDNSYENFRSSLTASNRYLDNLLGVFLEANFQRAQRGSDEMTAKYLPEGGVIKTKDVSLADRQEKRDRYGASVVLDYALDNGEVKFNSLYSRTDRDEKMIRKRYRIESSLTEITMRDRQVNVDLFSNAITGKYDFDFINVSWNGSYAISNQKTPFSHDSRFEETGAYNKNVQDLGPDGVIADAKNNLSETYFRYDYLNYQKLNDRDFAAQVDFMLPLVLHPQVVTNIKFGGKYKDKSREVDNKGYKTPSNASRWLAQQFPGRFILTPSQANMSVLNFLDGDNKLSEFLNGKYNFGALLSGGKLQSFLDEFRYYRNPTNGTRFYGDDELSAMENYSAGESVTAGYLMGEIKIGEWGLILPGFRYEKTNNWYKTAFGEIRLSDEGDLLASQSVDTIGTLGYDDFLPMVHARINVTDWADVRMAYTKTISRPDYYNLVPRKKVDADAHELFYGQPYIGHITSNNFDMAVSAYNSTFGLLSIGGFYKTVDNIDYIRKSRITYGSTVYDLYQPENIKNQTKVYGFETEIQTNLVLLPYPFDGIVININFSKISSETFIPYNINYRDTKPPFKVTSIDTVRKIQMPGQSDKIANVTLGYEKGAFSLRLSFIYQSSALAVIGATPEVDGYTDDYQRWDCTLQYKLKKNLAFTFNMNNITDLPDKSFTSSKSLPTEEKYFGWTADFGVKYEF